MSEMRLWSWFATLVNDKKIFDIVAASTFGDAANKVAGEAMEVYDSSVEVLSLSPMFATENGFIDLSTSIDQTQFEKFLEEWNW